MFIAALVKMLPAPQAMVAESEVGCYDQLIHNCFQPGLSQMKKSSVIAFTSASPGAGTSFVLQELGLELAEYERERTAIVDADRLQTISKSDLEKWSKLCSASGAGLSWLKNDEQPPSNSRPKSRKKTAIWHSDVRFRQESLQLLRKYFDYVLIDCHTVNTPGVLTRIATLVDGVVIVIAAGQTRSGEIRRAEQVVEMAQGKVLGLVLNKRKYPIPKWLYRKI